MQNWSIFLAILLVVTIKGHQKQCWGGWTRKCLEGWGVMIRLGVGGISAVMGEWCKQRNQHKVIPEHS